MDSAPASDRANVPAELVLEHLADPVLVLDAAGRVVRRNRAARDALRLDLALLFERRDPHGEIEAFLGRVRTEGAAELALAPGADADWLGLSGTALGDGCVVVIRDLSAERARDDELRQLRRLESVGMLTASLVHDFNNLLTPLLLLSGVLAQDLAGTASEPLVQQLSSAAERASALARDVLAFARPGAARTMPVDVSPAVAALHPLLERVVGAGVATELVLEPDAGHVALDRAGLEHALLNLVVNARDAMPGGGRLTISTALDADAGGGRGSVVVTVRDTGVGMSADVLRRAGERFFTTKPLGNGVGLASVRRFVTESGGTLSMDSAPGRGTTVAIRLPRCELAAAEAAPEVRLQPRTGDETILVIDPHDDVRRAVRIALEASGYRVVEAASTELADEVVRRASIDLVLIDAALAREAGRRVESVHGPRSILMSADRSKDDWRAEPGHAVLHKAFSEHELLRAVREALDGSRGAG